ncbi:hypothetical protein [Paraglaciecola sp. 2405UD69-4]|uniref:COG4648 family protein n=1 Tax=Paraglaciecola sp. 2405UD69-4 TaxID=3391836 RepID=UPI0039C97E16
MSILLTILAVLYPIIAYFGLKYCSPSIVSGLLIALLALRFVLDKSSTYKPKHFKWIFGAVLTLLVFSLLSNSDYGIKFYPVAMSLMFFAVFGYSLISPPTIIERFARIKNKNLSDYGVSYTRFFTKVWCVFFIINASISSYTAMYSDIEIWTLYNGVISYVLMGVLGASEWLIRQTVKHKH